jgi:HEAT repeat protein
LLATAALAAQRPRAANAAGGSAVSTPVYADGAAPSAPSPQSVLQSAAASPQEKYDAASRLINRKSTDTPKVLSDVLNNGGDDQSRLAVARALANDPTPDPSLCDSLFNLIGTTPAMTEAACQALAAYRLSPPAVATDVMNRLIARASVPSRPEYIRGAALRALGTFGEKDAAATLIATLLSPDSGTSARAASADALSEMTGLNFGRDVQQWQQWWAGNQQLSPGQFHEQIVRERADHFEQEIRRRRQLAQETQAILASVYARMAASEKSAALDQYLKSIAPEIRVAGANIILDSLTDGKAVPPSAMAQLRTMVGDSSTEVRLIVAQVLYNDTESLGALLLQLKIETDPDVKVELLRSIAPMHDLSAVDEMLQMLVDPSYRVEAAAADALYELGQAGKFQTAAPGVEQKVARGLLATFNRTTAGDPGTEPLRESCARAMATLQDPLLTQTFLDLVRANEAPAVHVPAVRGLGDLKDPRMAPVIYELFSRDPDAGVRLEAVKALGKIPAPRYAGQMVDAMSDPTADESLRQAAWETLQAWFPAMDDNQLQTLYEELHEKLPQQPDKQLGVLQALAAYLQKQPARGNDLAGVRQQIGDLLMQLNQPADAAAQYRQALAYWKANNGTGVTIERLTQELIDSLLQAKQFDDATAFAASSLATRANVRIVSSPLRDAAQKLADAGDETDAQALITSIEKMSPPLPDPYLGDVEQTKARLGKK